MRITGVPSKIFCPIDQQQIIIESYDVLAENIKFIFNYFDAAAAVIARMIISESRIEEIISDTVKRTLERYHSADESPTSDTDTYTAAASIVVRP